MHQRRSFSTLKTALHELHQSCGAKMVDFTGYSMPLQYAGKGIMKEHLHCREACSLFDVSHMGQINITGKDTLEFMDLIQTGDVESLGKNRSALALILNHKAGIMDDTIITDMGDRVQMVLNSGNKWGDLEHIRELAKEYQVEIEHQEDRALLAVQGPQSKNVLETVLKEGGGLDKLVFMDHVMRQDIWGGWVGVSRSGYTGEDGFEVSVEGHHAVRLAESLMKHPQVEWAGLGARDSLRLEAGLCLHGNDIDQTTDPVMAALMWTVRKKKRNFVGAQQLQAIIKNKSSMRKRVGLVVKGKGIVRAGAKLVDGHGQEIGLVTSGTMSPSLNQGIAMAYLDKSLPKDSPVFAVVRDKMISMESTKMPFVPVHYQK